MLWESRRSEDFVEPPASVEVHRAATDSIPDFAQRRANGGDPRKAANHLEFRELCHFSEHRNWIACVVEHSERNNDVKHFRKVMLQEIPMNKRQLRRMSGARPELAREPDHCRRKIDSRDLFSSALSKQFSISAGTTSHIQNRDILQTRELLQGQFDSLVQARTKAAVEPLAPAAFEVVEPVELFSPRLKVALDAQVVNSLSQIRNKL